MANGTPYARQACTAENDPGGFVIDYYLTYENRTILSHKYFTGAIAYSAIVWPQRKLVIGYLYTHPTSPAPHRLRPPQCPA